MAHILVIEDNPSNMKLAVLVLENAGYETIQAADAETGLRLVRERQPDLILMDIQLPGMDGLEATRMLKSDPATRETAVLALTAFAMSNDAKRIYAAGCDGYIVKPIEYKKLLAEVERWLPKGGTAS